MGPSPTYNPPEADGCATSVQYGVPHWAEPAEGNCSWRLDPSPNRGRRFVGAHEIGPLVGAQKSAVRPLHGQRQSQHELPAYLTLDIPSPW